MSIILFQYASCSQVSSQILCRLWYVNSEMCFLAFERGHQYSYYTYIWLSEMGLCVNACSLNALLATNTNIFEKSEVILWVGYCWSRMAAIEEPKFIVDSPLWLRREDQL